MPLALATAAFKALGSLRRQRHERRQLAAAASAGLLPSELPAEVLVEWSALDCTLTDSKTGVERKLLNSVSGTATPGRLLAIMGPR